MMKGKDIPTLFGLPAADNDDLKTLCNFIEKHTDHLDDQSFEKLFGRYIFRAYASSYGPLMFKIRRRQEDVFASVVYKREDEVIEDVDVKIF